jgi:hypothetical protein
VGNNFPALRVLPYFLSQSGIKRRLGFQCRRISANEV